MKETERDRPIDAHEHEIEMSARIQRSLLMAPSTEIPAGIDLKAQTIPSARVDGDFFDILRLSADTLDFIVADVMGKGVTAALTAAGIKNAIYKGVIKQYADGLSCPLIRDIVTVLEESISRELIKMKTFFTMYYCRIDQGKGLFSFVDAGHTSFVYYCAKDATCWAIKGTNMPIGFTERQQWREYAMPIAAGDIMFFYSDGISELVNSDGEPFGESRLLRFIASHAELDAKALLDLVMNVTFFYSALGFKDDVTALIVKIGESLPAGTTGRERAMPVDRENLRVLEDVRARFCEDFSSVHGNTHTDQRDALCIALLEAAGNGIRHTGESLSLDWTIREDHVTVTLDFVSPTYDWQPVLQPDITRYSDHGFGEWLIQQGAGAPVIMKGLNDRKRLSFFHKLQTGKKT